MNWGFDRIQANKSLLTGGVAAAAHPPTLGVFDWTCVAVGHWHAVTPAGYGKSGHRLYACVSRCGVLARIRDSELAAGHPLTCEACRPGTACPPAARVLAEAAVARQWGTWSVEMIGNNLKGREAPEDWTRFGEPAVRAFLAAAGYPADWGWKVFIRECSRGCAGQRHPVRVRSVNPAARRLEVAVCPAGSRYRFHVNLSTGRQCDFPAVLVALRAAAERTPDPTPEAAPGPAAAATPGAVAAAAGAQKDRLVRMRDGLDRLIQASGDIAAAEAMLAEARAALAAAEAAAAGEGRALETAESAARDAAAEIEALTRREAELAAELAATSRAQAATGRARAAAEAAARARAAELDAARERHRPLAGRVAEAAAAVREAETLHAERTAAVARAGDLSVLLAAMERLAG